MKKLAILGTALLISVGAFAQKITIKTGVEVLKEQKFKVLEGKRVGLITNPTGVDNNLKSTIDILHEASNVKLVALFAPEHGVRGDVHAGDDVDNMIDPKTNLPVHSLHGKTKVPTDEMLEGIDALVYDIQDIGCRSFTYISTMGLAMEAAAKKGIEFIVLDRPNPIGGEKIEGNYTEEGFVSFISQFKIPYLYGMTCGELAKYLNEEGLTSTKAKLTVVPMKKWKRSMRYEETGLQWIASSPHIPHPISATMYPASGILGELYYVSIGVGYPLPFEVFGATWIKATDLAANLNALNIEGVHFRPIYYKPFYSTSKGENLEGVQIHLMDYRKARLSDIQFYVMEELQKLYPEQSIFANASEARFNMFDKATGTDQIRLMIAEKKSAKEILKYWHKDEADFKAKSKKYYLYK